MKITREIAYAAGMDAGNRSMRKAGRATWDADDYCAASRETLRLMVAGKFIEPEVAYEMRVSLYEAHDMTRSDAQGVVDAEDLNTQTHAIKEAS